MAPTVYWVPQAANGQSSRNGASRSRRSSIRSRAVQLPPLPVAGRRSARPRRPGPVASSASTRARPSTSAASLARKVSERGVDGGGEYGHGVR